MRQKMVIDSKTSKRFVETKNNTMKKMIKITKNIAISMTLIALLTACSDNISKKDVIDIKQLEIESQNQDIYNVPFFKNGYILIPSENEGKYYYYDISDLILTTSKDGEIHLMDLRRNDIDIFNNKMSEKIDSNSTLLFKNSNILYDIYMDNVDNIQIDGKREYLIIEKDELKNYVNSVNEKSTFSK